MSARPSVGVVCHFPPPPGGMPAQAEALVAGLEREGVAVRRIATNLRGSRAARWLDDIRGVRTLVRAPLFLVRLAAALPGLTLLHVLSGSGLSFLIFTAPAVLVAAALGRRVVLHYHGGGARAFFLRWPRLVRFVARRADAIIVPSGFVQEAFTLIGLEASVVPNLCDTDPFPFAEQQPGAPVLLVARHLEPIYNVECALRAFAQVVRRHPEARLIVAGGGSQDAMLKALAADLGLGPAVTFTGYVSHTDVRDLYRSATIFVNSSNVDNFPISILEAFSSGLAVVTTAAGGIPYVVTHEANGLLVGVGQADELAAGITRLIEDRPLRERLRRQGRRDVERYSWRSVYPCLRAIYEAA
jgi:glycosyltransferase involved in cell wall biosynthesis